MNSNKYKVLVIEDEGNIRHFVKTILTTNGYQVVEAKNVAEVLDPRLLHPANAAIT